MTVTLPRAHARPIPARAGARQWLALAVLFLPTLLVAVDNTVLSFALPAITTALVPSATTLLWMVDAYPLVLAGLLVTMGTVGDRIGVRRLLVVGVSGFGIVSLAASFATDAAHLVAARALLGFFGAMLMPSTLALIRSLFTDRDERRLALAIWATGFAAGAALGPLVGGVLLAHFWWGSVFLVNVPVTVLIAVLAVVMLPEARHPRAGRLDLVGAALSLLAVAPIVLAVKLVGSGGSLPLAVAALVVGVGAAAGFVRRARRLTAAGRDPVLDVRLLRSPVLRVAMLANLTTMAALTGLLFFSAQYLQLVLGLDPMRSGLLLLPGFVATVVAGLGAAALARRFPIRTLVPAGLATAGAGYALCVLLGTGTTGGLLVAAGVLVGSGIGLTETLTNDVVLTAAPVERAGSASAMSETAYELGAVLGTAVLGSVLTAVYRGRVDAPAGPARETLGGAVDVAAVTGDPALLDSARGAFTLAVDVTAGVGAGWLVAVAVTAWVVLHRERRWSP
ncbi:MFS transporter [Pseudonocardia dioxanivorans]|uniref:MFS transporter n=1 Tax=Pseudonocardia dioxanivorans TaxID=240495 RepID=UPI000CD0F9B8|nr:MFS transporter [Pseudonocardia dioxanivorans]